MTRLVTCQKLEEGGVDLVSPIAIEGWLLLMDLHGLLDLPRKPLLLSLQDPDVIHAQSMTSVLGVLMDG